MGVLFLASSAAGAPTHIVLVEAEAFDERGGWAVDQQFMDQMGSPYLLAHGLGEPVQDARTSVVFPHAGPYRVWVRTRDWVAPWNAPGAPGRFQMLVDGEPLETVFGAEGADWHWQDGGTVTISDKTAVVALHDLTGFEGRCDAIVFADGPGFVPPNGLTELDAFRKAHGSVDRVAKPAGRYDLVVVGGGIAGTCAALVAARLGLTVALVQDRPVLGGNNSSEVRVWLGGETNFEPHPRIGDVVRELEPLRRGHPGTAEMYEDDRRIAVVEAEDNIALFLNHRVNKVNADKGRIRSVVAQHTISGRRLRLVGRWFADCTGDGVVGFLAGADHEMTIDGHMGRSNLWSIVDTGRPVTFPRCPWAVDLTEKPFPTKLGQWFWESGFYRDPISEGERIRDGNLRAMYGAWDCLKNVRGEYPTHKLEWAAYVAGKRESRRLLGDVVLAQEDLVAGKSYPDGCVPSTWRIDLHLPDERYSKGFEGDEFIAAAHYTDYERPYWIPYRCLYSRNIANLFMAGRDISVTHEALGAVRVMRTCGMMGEVVGMAASLCRKHGTSPRGVYEDHLVELQDLMREGAGKEPAHARAAFPPLPPVDPEWGGNQAPLARATSSGDRDPSGNPLASINDGVLNLRDNAQRWLSAAVVPNWVEFEWPAPRLLHAVRIVSGYYSNGTVTDPIETFALQHHDGSEWRDIPQAGATGNRDIAWSAEFGPVRARRLRLLVTQTPGNISRIHEVELYGRLAEEP